MSLTNITKTCKLKNKKPKPEEEVNFYDVDNFEHVTEDRGGGALLKLF